MVLGNVLNQSQYMRMCVFLYKELKKQKQAFFFLLGTKSQTKE